MMNNYNKNPASNNPGQGDNESERDTRLHSLVGAPLTLSLPQNFPSTSSFAPTVAGAPAAPGSDFNQFPSLQNTNSAITGHSMLSCQFDSQLQAQMTQNHNMDMSAHQNFVQNEGLAGLFSQPKQNQTNMEQSMSQMNDSFGMHFLNQSQNFPQNEGLSASGLFNMSPSHQMNQSRRMSNSVSDSGISDYQQFFGSALNAQNQSVASASNEFLGVVPPLPNIQASGTIPTGLLGQQNPLGSQLGDMSVQNTLMSFGNSLSMSSSQGALLNAVNLKSALNNSWQQQQQQAQIQLQQQQAQHQQAQLQQQQLQRPMLQQGVDDAPLVASSLQLPPEIKWKGRGRSSTFPLKLHQMLIDLETQDGRADIASFLLHGRGFQIHKPKDFCRDVMPNYFRMSTFSSFQRQLNLYDFQRISDGPEKGAYWHELFLKDHPMLSTNMKRSKVKGVTRARQEQRLKNYELQKELSDRKNRW